MQLQVRAEDARAAFWEGLLIFAVGAVGLALHKPLLFASLGPTAYEQCEYPHRASSRPWSVFAGHLVAIAVGFAVIALLHAGTAGKITGDTAVNWPRLAASAIAVAITAALNLLLNASQPAAFASALLVTMGAFQSARGAVSLVAAVLLIGVLGEIVRRRRLHVRPPDNAVSGL